MPATRRLEVLISCMHQPDLSLARRTNLSSDAVIINQCDTTAYHEGQVAGHRVRMYSCTDRGLSRSRNKAIALSTADICLLCDDDEHLEDQAAEKIAGAYAARPDADVIAFRVDYPSKKCWSGARRVGRLDALKIASCQITFKRESVLGRAIAFDERFGAGTAYSPGEDNIFLYDCLNSGLKVYYVPTLIATAEQAASTWFHGFTEKFFLNRGITTRFYMGVPWATAYALYYALAKFPLYRKDRSFLGATANMLAGIYSTKISRPY